MSETTIDDCLIDVFGFPSPEKVETIVNSDEEAKARKKLRKIYKKSKKRLLDEKKQILKKPKHNYNLDFEEKGFCDNISKISYCNVLATDLCLHEVVLPPEYNFTQLTSVPKEKRSKKYAFQLDPFQVQATQCIDNNQSVLVSAHTSAGKTAVAEYAIATCLQQNQRVIYTTPIKALSNQKFSDFKDEFGDVGLMTGDTTINEDASCIVMTTEILRAMLYEGADMIREVGWVIFDEIHYMRDKERGYVWEESIILLSASAKFVFLSATIPNAREFAKWICFVHNQPCHVVYTESRPTPLEHYVFPANTGEIYRIVDTTGKVKEDNFNKAMASLQKGAQTDDITTAKKDVKANAAFDCFKLVKTIIANHFEPAIIFSFSKKECELYARQSSKLTFTNKPEQAKINEMIDCALETISTEDRTLPSILAYTPYLRKGIGVHHGGLLPIIKELTELLFGEGLVKVLFATETFSMGLNMPARAVLFTSLQKFDGKARRWITAGEYIQMSGRAGRRGKDDKGIVIMKVDDSVNTTIVKNYLKGKSDPINSAFHLTYNMVLNTLRSECTNPEYILKRSFFQFQNFAKLPDLLTDLKKRTKMLKSLRTNDTQEVEHYYKLSENLKNLYLQRHNRMVECKRFKNLLMHGRLVKVIHNGVNFGWCAVCTSTKNTKTKADDNDTNVVILTKILTGSLKIGETNVIHDINLLRPPKSLTTWESVIAAIPHTSIWEVSTRVLTLPEPLQTSPTNRKISIRLVDECLANYPKEKLFVDPVTHLFLTDPEFMAIVDDIANTIDALARSPVHTASNRDELLENAKVLTETQLEIDALAEKVDATKGIAQMNELKHSRRVLLRLGFLTESDVITTKGSLACELSAANELLLVEMIFDGQFKDLDAAECCALLSTFVCTDKAIKPPKLKPSLSNGLNQLQDSARRIAKVLWFCRLNDNEESFVEQFQPYLMEVVYYWCKGRSFKKVCEKTTIFAGNIVRAMRRLEVLLRQMIKATTAVGMEEHTQKLTEAIKLIKRDIIGVESLYTPA